MALSQSKWNVACHLLDGVFFIGANIAFSVEIVIPKMISDLSNSALLLGLVPLVIQLCALLPQTFYAKKIEGLSYKKPAVLFCAFLQRAGWLAFLLSLFLGWSAAFTLPVFFAVVAVNSFGSGLITPVWTDWYAKTVPERMWGKLLGARAAVPAVLGLALGKLIQHITGVYAAPRRYQILLILSIAFYALSFLFVMLVKEDRHDGLPSHEKTSWGRYFRDLASLLRRRDFGAFIVASVLVTVPLTVITSFLTRYGLTYPGVEAGITGRFTMFYFGAMAVGSVFGGFLSDRGNPLAPFHVFPLFTLAACVVSAASARPQVVSAAWSLLGFAWGMRITAMLPAVFRFSEPHRRAAYAAILFTALGIGAFLPPLLGVAKDADLVTFPHVFLLSGALAVAGWVLFLRMPAPQRAEDLRA